MVRLLRDGALGSAYSWDAENRLTQVVTRRDPAGTFCLGDTKVEFADEYDPYGPPMLAPTPSRPQSSVAEEHPNEENRCAPGEKETSPKTNTKKKTRRRRRHPHAGQITVLSGRP